MINTSVDSETEERKEETESIDDDPIIAEARSRLRREGAGTGVTHFEPDTGGRQYFDQKCVYKQFLQKQRLKRTKCHVSLTLTMKKMAKEKNHCLFQIAVKSAFLSAQMSAKKGIKLFGERAVAAMVKEFRQLDKGAFPGKAVVEPIDPRTLTKEELEQVMEAINLIKEKRDGTMKGRTCADGSCQRKFLKIHETVASPTVSTEGLLSTFIIDAYEGRHIGSFDIPGAYLHTSMPKNKQVVMRLRGKFVDMMCEANPKYRDHVVYENGQKVLYSRVLQAIYGCIESALLWYNLFKSTLEGMGFTINPYDRCVANKIVNGHQCTVVWYVDDAKVSHKDPQVVKDVVAAVEKELGR